MDKFVCDIFFLVIDRLLNSLKDLIICYVMDEYFRGLYKYEKILWGYWCILILLDGYYRFWFGELIDFIGVVSSLFFEEEYIFLIGLGFLRVEWFVVLRNFGMVEVLLLWERICERVMFIVMLVIVNYEKVLLMLRNLIKYLNDSLSKLFLLGI